ncbi:glycoside hydrolase family 88 protein [Chengkuizengella axinellae]|uniref:Glycoside hydrolase family 88 protein n=1 Tax=Chengkuizengella axinellae TaxID=3064388 RepID=A0ABT9J2V2_9BACL|nr:glycoside hydrolase family 88 protein [Chengkuizengella sp. 2205SS18-9]MDP5275929.1 glycoside hydrolase family 88 protein [Chengkuizengella sp. 2205SS18-9]
MWKRAIEDAVIKTKMNVDRFGDMIPHVSENDKYHLNDNKQWTSGFWTGLLWLSYEYSKDPALKEAAKKWTRSFKTRLNDESRTRTHDIGFLYSLSTKAHWLNEKDEEAKQLTIQAAETLLKRWRPNIQALQAWGPEGDTKNGGRIIIDCLMNLPLLYWATEVTGDPKYKEIAEIHAEQSRRYLVRGDDSSYHTFYFDQETGDAVRGGTHQGYLDGSTWTRGQAWGIYGFALSYRYTRNPLFLETSKRMAKYFFDRLPEDDVVYWDFDVEINEDTKRDSSASAIASAGTLELMTFLDEHDPLKQYLKDSVHKSMSSLVNNYSTIGEEAEGLIKRGSYSVRSGNAPDDFVIWGDYYYLEALLRLEKGITGYWYER